MHLCYNYILLRVFLAHSCSYPIYVEEKYRTTCNELEPNESCTSTTVSRRDHFVHSFRIILYPPCGHCI